jgi:hypothetical protein
MHDTEPSSSLARSLPLASVSRSLPLEPEPAIADAPPQLAAWTPSPRMMACAHIPELPPVAGAHVVAGARVPDVASLPGESLDEARSRFEALLDSPRFSSFDVAFVAGVCERTVQRHLKERYPYHQGHWRLSRQELLAVVADMNRNYERERLRRRALLEGESQGIEPETASSGVTYTAAQNERAVVACSNAASSSAMATKGGGGVCACASCGSSRQL